MKLFPYDRKSAVDYAHRWALSYNPAYYNYNDLGGDCTNFVSQCIFAGTGQMNYTPTYGWYYLNGNKKSPSWTGVPYLFDFLIRKFPSPGPIGKQVRMSELQIGDIVQISFNGARYQHTPIIVGIEYPINIKTIFVAAHSNAADYRALETYAYKALRFIQIQGYYKAKNEDLSQIQS